jgi:hypothetical protein
MHTEKEHRYFEEVAAKAASLIFAHRNESEASLISILAKEFGNNLTARKIYYFLPITFGWVLLKKMGVQNFPSTFKVLNKNNKEVEFNVSGQDIFMGSLTLAFNIFEHGYTEIITQEVVTELINRSSEVDAANRALNAGSEIKGATLQATLIHSIKAEELLGVGS